MNRCFRASPRLACIALCLVLVGYAPLIAQTKVALKTATGQRVAQPKVTSGEPQWIWSSQTGRDQITTGVRYFRKTFDATNAESALVQIACDDAYELFINGRRVGAGDDWHVLGSFNIKAFLQPGLNCIAVKARNETPGSAGLVARVTVRSTGGTDVAYATDASWKVNSQEVPGWDRARFNDASWPRAKALGDFGSTPPWNDQVVAADGNRGQRFTNSPDFRVERVLTGEQTGSLAAMTINEFGEFILAPEQGPLLIAIDQDGDDLVETVLPYCDKIKGCQGLLALNGQVYAIGEGPEGPGLYRLSDDDQDRKAETVKLLFNFDKPMGEHGQHALVLGPDGFIYVMIGNHSSPKKEYEANSPYHHFYEGDLVQPKYEDAGGHAVGVKAPGGTVIRTDTDGSFVQLFAGGFRNAYDLAFNQDGELFTFDSDMEWDMGLPWYRPTRVNHILPGGEFGWRSGWSLWPEYYPDSLPAMIELGRGSPTGMEFYNHHKYPTKYHDCLFACDWSQGRILAIHLKRSGASFEATSEVFVEGKPLNGTDIAVAPDGWLYFATGGRDTEGGLYRIVYLGKPPERPKLKGIAQALRQPQLHSAWGRQQVADIQQKMGETWGPALKETVISPSVRTEDRVRALEIMQLFGPFPTNDLLLRLSADQQPAVRIKAAYLMGIHVDQEAGQRLVKLLDDKDPAVRRQACESLVRSGFLPPAEPLLNLLADKDWFVVWAARRALEKLPVEEWQSTALGAAEARVFIGGALAVLTLDPQPEAIALILKRSSKFLQAPIETVGDEDFLDLLRILELALIKGKLSGKDLPELREQLAEEYPSADWRMNRELVRLLVYLQEPSVLPRMIATLKDKETPMPEKIHVAAYLRFMKSGWTSDRRFALMQFYEEAHRMPGGYSYGLYFNNFSRDFAADFSKEEQDRLLAEGERWPTAAMTVLTKLPEQPGDRVISQLIELDGKLELVDTRESSDLALGIVAILGRSGDSKSMTYLRQQFEADPDRRAELSMGLAQHPNGENWPLLVRSLAIVDGVSAQEVLTQLARAAEKPTEPEPFRQVILCGLKLGDNGGEMATVLLEKWTGKRLTPSKTPAADSLAAWQTWFHDTYPDLPPAELPVEAEGARWTYDELLAYLTNPETPSGQPERGRVVFEKAQCIKCHRYGRRGEGVGPDLTTVSQRFQKKEILQSVIFPSHVISDQYASKTVTTMSGKAYTGIVAPSGALAKVILQASGVKVTVNNDEIDEITPSKKSAMPEGLFNNLSLEEIADLFAFFATPPEN